MLGFYVVGKVFSHKLDVPVEELGVFYDIQHNVDLVWILHFDFEVFLHVMEGLMLTFQIPAVVVYVLDFSALVRNIGTVHCCS
jgi:hypothetical protein